MSLAEVPEGTIPWDRSLMKINVSHDEICANVRTNIRRQLPQLHAHPPRPDHCAIVGGGWSLEETLPELVALQAERVKIFALNGAGNYLWQRNIRPNAVVMLDAKDHDGNRSFVKTAIPRCRYLLASQCHPSIFEICEGRDVTLWHATAPKKDDEEMAETNRILDAFYGGAYHHVIGGGTVGTSVLWLVKLLGFRFLHLFGVDSCYAPDGRHHSYPQEMNEGEGTKRFWCAGKTFRCSAWQASQAGVFRDMTDILQDMNIQVHGDGLIAHLIKTGAALEEA